MDADPKSKSALEAVGDADVRSSAGSVEPPTAAAKLRHVLWDFSQECPLPTLDDVRRWQAKHPEHADEILAHAVSVIEDVLDPDIDGYEDL